MTEQKMQELAEPYEFVERPLRWHDQGLTETASGYGKRLTSRWKVKLPTGKEYRVYVTVCGNAGSAWINIRGARYYVRDVR